MSDDKMDALTALALAYGSHDHPTDREDAEAAIKTLAELGYHLTPITPVQGELDKGENLEPWQEKLWDTFIVAIRRTKYALGDDAYIALDTGQRIGRIFSTFVSDLAVQGLRVVPAVTADLEVKAASGLIQLAYAVWQMLDGGEEIEDGKVIMAKSDLDEVYAAFDELETLPDDQPRCTMGPCAMARWALRSIVGADDKPATTPEPGSE